MKKILFILAVILFLSHPAGTFAYEKVAGEAGILKSNVEYLDPRVEKLQSYLEERNPEFAELSAHIVREADRLSIDWRLIPAIAGLESTFCRFKPAGSFNCWGWGIPSGSSTGIRFTSYADGITRVSEGLRLRYYDHGLVTIDDIGHMYAASPTWAVRVRMFMREIDEWQSTLAMKITL